jgi:hypothetical protein
MIQVKIDGKKASKMLDNLIKYSNGFLEETKSKESTVTQRLADLSIDGFYDYLDQLARVNPAMLHHVYEWGRVGDPSSRLFELKRALSRNNAIISSEFIKSEVPSNSSNEPFYEKAKVMEEGIPIIIQEVRAQALFFEIDGEEYFRTGPIVIENPGGPDVRGSFVEQFQQFYNVYLEDVYLRAIRFYEYFMDTKEYEKNFKDAVKSNNADAIGRKTALSWIENMPTAWSTHE